MAACLTPDKQRHRSKWAALKARDRLEAERGIDIALRPYPCQGHWHLGHKGMSPKSQMKRALAAGRIAWRATRR